MKETRKLPNARKKEKGFTLVEVLIAIFVFLMLMGAIINLLVSAVQTQMVVSGEQKAVEEISYITEYMSRSLRMAKRDDSGSCLGIPYKNYNYLLLDMESGEDYGSRIRFLNYQDQCQEFFIGKGIGCEEGTICERKSSDDNYDEGKEPIPMTSSRIDVQHLYFWRQVAGWHLDSEEQSKVMVNMKFKPEGSDVSIILQTTISQRNLNVPKAGGEG